MSPWGIHGGHPGGRAELFINRAGGGWGPPEARDRQRVRDDLLDGFITPEQARTVYGLAE